MPFAVEFSKRARQNIIALRKRDQQIIYDAIAVQLVHRPNQATRNRKQLEDNPLAPWELRVGHYRVFYDVDPDAAQVVDVAVGKKEGSILRIGGEVIEL
jgi:mRNA-degrading endonuclease RelE of RelBE toxin-antitoxin system